MRVLFVILGVVALLALLGGAFNHGTEVSIDYLVGSTGAISLFWLALGAGAALLLAGLAGWAVGQAGAGTARAKLERELESTYRRLRECEARLPRTPSPGDEASTAVAPAPSELATAVLPAPADEPVTAVTSAPADEAATAVTPAPADEAATADTPTDEASTAAGSPDRASTAEAPGDAPAPG